MSYLPPSHGTGDILQLPVIIFLSALCYLSCQAVIESRDREQRQNMEGTTGAGGIRAEQN